MGVDHSVIFGIGYDIHNIDNEAFMRTLIFIPSNYGYGDNSRHFFKEEIAQRLELAASHQLGNIRTIDAEAEYEATSWDDLLSTLKHYSAEFDCVVIAVDGQKVNDGTWNVKNYIEAITRETSGIPIVAYVDEFGPETNFRLISSDFSFVVNRADSAPTLGAAVGRAIALRSASGRRLGLGPLSVDLMTGDAYIDDARIHLTPKEAELLLLMARRKGSVVSRETMMSALYSDSDDVPDLKILDVFICKMRKKITDLSTKYPVLGSVIGTVWGRGYELINYAPEELRFSIGPLALRYDVDQRDYVTLDDKLRFKDIEVVVLGLLAAAENNPVTLNGLQESLAETGYGFMAVEALRQMLDGLRGKTRFGSEGTPMLRSQTDGGWILFNPYLGRVAEARRQAEITLNGTQEFVDGIEFWHGEKSTYASVNGKMIKLTPSQFMFFNFLSQNKGKALDTKPMYIRLINPPTALQANFAFQVRRIVTTLNKRMRKVPGYTPIHLIRSDRIIGMAKTVDELASAAATQLQPASGGDSSQAFIPIQRGITKDLSAVFRDGDLFDMARAITDIDTGWFTLRVNNQSKSAFIPDKKSPISFNPPETLFLLRLWYAQGGIVVSEEISPKAATVSLQALKVQNKLARNPEWLGIVCEVPGGFCFKLNGGAPGAKESTDPKSRGDVINPALLTRPGIEGQEHK
jgi:DNA-binding response OmpR family regulator